MLIDIVPEPSPGPRNSRLAIPFASEPPSERSDSFGTILARSDRTPSGGQGFAPEAEAPLVEAGAESPSADAETRAPDGEGKPRADAFAVEAGSTDSRPVDGRVLPDTPRLADTSMTGQGARTDSGARASILESGSLSGAALGRDPTTPDDGAAGERAAPALPRAPRVGGMADRDLAADIARAPTMRSSAADASSGSARDAEARPQVALAESLTASQARHVSGKVAPTPPIAESVLRARMNEARFPVSRLPEGLATRLVDGAIPGFAAGFGEPGGLSASSETAGARLLSPANSASAEAARDIGQQIAARIMPLARGQFTLTLAPAELGRLEISLREIDGLMTLSVNAERPETLEMIRRHVDLLAQELRQIAQRELSLHVGTGGAGSKAGDQGAEGGEAAAGGAGEASALDDAAADLSPSIMLDHLDLRL